MSTARRLSSPWLKKGLLNASALDLAMIVLSKSKKAAVRARPAPVAAVSGVICCGGAESGTVTDPA